VRWVLASDQFNSDHREEWDYPDEALLDRTKNWPANFEFKELFFDFGDYIQAIAFTTAGLIYGGLHLLAWIYPFVSHTQRVLWRICAVGVAASGLFMFFLRIVAQPDTFLWSSRNHFRYGLLARCVARILPGIHSLLDMLFQLPISLHEHIWLLNVLSPFLFFRTLPLNKFNGHNIFHILRRIHNLGL
jgi:hypothetical protein